MDESANQVLNSESGKYQVEFRGKGLEYFGIWIVNLCLTIITLGIYSAWAKVRTNRYFYGNTFIDESAFEYLANPMDILKGRVIAVILFGGYSFVNQVYPAYASYPFLVLMLLLPGIIVFSMSFRMRNTAYRGLTFNFKRNFKHAYFVFGLPFGCFAFLFVLMALNMPETDPQTGEMTPEDAAAFLAFMQLWFIGFAALFLLVPVWDYLKSRFMVVNSGYGQSEFQSKATIWSFTRIYLAVGVVAAIGMLALFLLFAVTGGFGTDRSAGESYVDTLAFAYFVMTLPLMLYIFAYLQAYRLNTIFNTSSLEGVRIKSTLTASYLFYLYLTNTIAIILSVGLLIPWAMVRTARYRADSVALTSRLPLNQFVQKQEQQRSAVGEEIGEVFDLDIGL